MARRFQDAIHDRHTPPAVISAMPHAIRASKFSLKTNHASNAVNTPSRFRRSEALDAGVCTKPHISNKGPIIPPAKIAPASQGASLRFNGVSRAPFCGRAS
jgi:hypothetical protein